MGRIATVKDRALTYVEAETYPNRKDWSDYVPSERVLASKGKPAKYTVRFVQTTDPETLAKIEKISVGLAKIDANPHKDPKPAKPPRLMPTEAEMRAAAARVMAFRVQTVDPAEDCGARTHAGGPALPHVPMGDGRCAHCERHLAIPDAAIDEIHVSEASEIAEELTAAGYKASDAERLGDMGPHEVRERAKVPAGEVGSLTHTHGLEHASQIRYRVAQHGPDGAWESEIFTGTEREAIQCVIAGYLMGQPRWAYEALTYRFLHGLGAKGERLTGFPPDPVAKPVAVVSPAPAAKPRKARKPRKVDPISKRASEVIAAAMAERVARTGTTEPDRHEPPAEIIPITRAASLSVAPYHGAGAYTLRNRRPALAAAAERHVA